MPADEKVQRVMTRIGAWSPGQVCTQRTCIYESEIGWSCSCGFFLGRENSYRTPHDTKFPDPSDPAMIVAMLEWLIQFLKDHPEDRSWADVGAYTVYEDQPLNAALIDAIDALPED